MIVTRECPGECPSPSLNVTQTFRPRTGACGRGYRWGGFWSPAWLGAPGDPGDSVLRSRLIRCEFVCGPRESEGHTGAQRFWRASLVASSALQGVRPSREGKEGPALTLTRPGQRPCCPWNLEATEGRKLGHFPGRTERCSEGLRETQACSERWPLLARRGLGWRSSLSFGEAGAAEVPQKPSGGCPPG